MRSTSIIPSSRPLFPSARNCTRASKKAKFVSSENYMNSSFIHAIENKAAEVDRAIASGPILPRVTAGEIRKHLTQHYSFETPLPLEEVADDVESIMSNWQVQITHPRYFGLYNPSVTFASVLGDTLAAMYNPQLATWRTAPGPIEME